MNNFQLAGLTKDSLIRLLGEPDDREEGNFMYTYEKKPFLGGLGTSIEAIVFEFSPDGRVKLVRKNDGGWD